MGQDRTGPGQNAGYAKQANTGDELEQDRDGNKGANFHESQDVTLGPATPLNSGLSCVDIFLSSSCPVLAYL